MGAAYATTDDLIARYPVQVLADLISWGPDNVVAATSGAVAAHASTLAALNDAAGEIRSAAQAGGRYTESQLQAFADAAHNVSVNGDTLILSLNCDGAAWLLIKRKSLGQTPIPPWAERYEAYLAALRTGEKIFGVNDDTGAASLPTPTAGITLVTMTYQERQTLGLLADSKQYPKRGV